MEDRLNALNAQLALVKEENRIKYTELMSQVNILINKVILKDTARLIRSWADTDFNNEVFFRFEVGFHNHEKNEIDWGSEIDFTYESRTGMLSINHGCIGTFNKTNLCQFHRAALISYVFNNIDMIEAEFAKLADSAKSSLNTDNEWEIEWQIRDINDTLRKAALKNIEDGLTSGCTLAYVDDCRLEYRRRLFSKIVSIQRCTPKYVFVEDEWNRTLKLRKDELVNHIYSGYISNIKE